MTPTDPVRFVTYVVAAEEGEASRLDVPRERIKPAPAGRYETVVVECPWIYEHLDDSWVVAYRIVAQGGEPVVGEVRIYPRETSKDAPATSSLGPGEWSAKLLGHLAAVPRGGLTARLLKRVRLGAQVTNVKQVFQWWESQAYKDLAKRELDVDAVSPLAPGGFVQQMGFAPPRRRGRPPTPPLFYARLASDYVKALRGGSRRPVADLAEKRKVKVSVVRDGIRRARTLGLLTGGGTSGRVGGQLTPGARACLKEGKGRRVSRRPSAPAR